MNRLKSKLRNLNNNILGYAILGIGLFAVIFVAYFAYKSMNPTTEQEIAEKNEIETFKQSGAPNRAAGQIANQEDSKTYKRQKSISEKELKGLWEAPLKSGKALLEIKDGVFRIVIIRSDSSTLRYYLNGTYTIKDDLIILMPNAQWGPPNSQGQKYNYRILTNSSLPIVASKHDGQLIWQVPPKEVDIYVPPYHAFLNLTKNKIAVWNALK